MNEALRNNSFERVDGTASQETPENPAVLTVIGGEFQPHDPELLSQYLLDIAQNDIPAISVRATIYSLQLSGHVPTLEQYSRPLDEINEKTDEFTRNLKINEFLEFSAQLERAYDEVLSAQDLAANYAEKQRRELRESTKTLSQRSVPALRSINEMFRSEDSRVGLLARRLSEDILRVLYARQKEVKLPIIPENPLQPVDA